VAEESLAEMTAALEGYQMHRWHRQWCRYSVQQMHNLRKEGIGTGTCAHHQNVSTIPI
jgi:hypothetical protein